MRKLKKSFQKLARADNQKWKGQNSGDQRRNETSRAVKKRQEGLKIANEKR